MASWRGSQKRSLGEVRTYRRRRQDAWLLLALGIACYLAVIGAKGLLS